MVVIHNSWLDRSLAYHRAGRNSCSWSCLVPGSQASARLRVSVRNCLHRVRKLLTTHTFYLLWNIYQVDQRLACLVAQAPDTVEKLGTTSYGYGLLWLCDVSVPPPESVVESARTILPRAVMAPDEKPDPAMLALTVRALCHPSLRELASQMRSDVDVRLLRDFLESANAPPCQKQLFAQFVEESEMI